MGSLILCHSKRAKRPYEISRVHMRIYTIEELCSYFFCSRGTLLNHFKSKYNTTIHKFLLDYRLEIASELLINEKLSVKEISYKCGFEDPNYFCKVFRKKYNKSPLEFKNERT